jgi:hypothetical protein
MGLVMVSGGCEVKRALVERETPSSRQQPSLRPAKKWLQSTAVSIKLGEPDE